MEHNREDTVKKLIENAKAKGTVSVNEVMDALNEFDMSPHQMEEIYDQLAAAHVEITQPEPEVVLEAVEEIPDAFMGDALESDNIDYVLNLYTEYYEKQRVTIAEGE